MIKEIDYRDYTLGQVFEMYKNQPRIEYHVMVKDDTSIITYKTVKKRDYDKYKHLDITDYEVIYSGETIKELKLTVSQRVAFMTNEGAYYDVI